MDGTILGMREDETNACWGSWFCQEPEPWTGRGSGTSSSSSPISFTPVISIGAGSNEAERGPLQPSITASTTATRLHKRAPKAPVSLYRCRKLICSEIESQLALLKTLKAPPASLPLKLQVSLSHVFHRASPRLCLYGNASRRWSGGLVIAVKNELISKRRSR